MKRCSNCRKIKTLYLRGNLYYCGKCLPVKAQYGSGPILKYRLNHYGITYDDYQSMVEKQESKCAICKMEKILVIDHDHETGKVRGLLCTGCNTSLGKLKDSITLLNNAIRYLMDNKEKENE